MSWIAEWWPFTTIFVIGYLPHEVWRIFGVVLARGLEPDGEIVAWAEAVATAVVAIIIIRLILAPSGTMALLPVSLRWMSIAFAVVAYFLLRRSVLPALIVGESVLLFGAWLQGPPL